MKKYGAGAIVATAALTIGLAVMCHEAGHVVAGRLAGGSPTLVTATETRGRFEMLSPGGFVALGTSGSLVNVLFAIVGWWALRRRPSSAEGRLMAWFGFAVNGMIVALKMMGEPLLGFGDWMTVLRPFPGLGMSRVVVAAVGAAAVAFMVRGSGAALARIVPDGDPKRRTGEALRIVGVGGLTATVQLLVASVVSPVGTTRATLLALMAGIIPFVVLAFGVRFIPSIPSESADERRRGSWPWYLGAVGVTAVLWFVVGPGFDVSKLLR